MQESSLSDRIFRKSDYDIKAHKKSENKNISSKTHKYSKEKSELMAHIAS